jgi:Fe-S cluster assembly protein SufD
MKNIVIENTELTSSFLSEQAEFATAYASGPEWLKQFRQKGAEAFRGLGVPALKDEEWKYAQVSKQLNNEYTFTKADANCKVDGLEEMLLHKDSNCRIVLKNGSYCEELSQGVGTEHGIHIQVGVTDRSSELMRSLLEENKDIATDNFLALNTSFIKDIIFIHAEKNTISDQPVEIVHILGSESSDIMSYPRVLIYAEQGSGIRVTENFITPGNSGKGFHASVTEIVEEAAAKVDHVTFQDVDEHTTLVSQKYIRQQRDSRSGSFTLTLNGRFVRNNLKISLLDMNGHAELHGIYIPDGDQLVDNHTLVDHVSPHCYSNELYKGVMGGRSEGVFNGKVYVKRDAQKTNAYQSNNNILLTDDAQINTKPQLEIYADDVKCSHGATTGQLDDDALFYLRARGIGEAEARTLLVTAFMAEVLNEIDDEDLREKFAQKTEAKLLRMSEQ